VSCAASAKIQKIISTPSFAFQLVSDSRDFSEVVSWLML
jgi:hypothetical protein